MILLDLVWPALYVTQTYERFWFLVIGTIALEFPVLKYALHLPWKKAFVASLIGNCISGILGTWIMSIGMLFWHMASESILHVGSFDRINWIATYVLMCSGSVFIEILAVSLIYKIKKRKLFLPMLVGNLLSYIFIALAIMAHEKVKEIRVSKSLIYRFAPDRENILLPNKSVLHLDTASIVTEYDRSGRRLDTANPGYRLQLRFSTAEDSAGIFLFHCIDTTEVPIDLYPGQENLYVPGIKSEYKLVLEQKNPNDSAGRFKWRIIDTVVLRQLMRPKKIRHFYHD